jgi:hypothetical protein
MASLPSMRRPLLHRRDCYCCPHDNGVLAIVDGQASLPLSSWRCYPCNNGVVALDPQQHCCPCCNGIVVVLKLVSLPLLQGIFVIINVQASLPSLQWHCCPHCNGVAAVDAQASLLSSQWQLLPPVTMASLP